MKKNMVLLVLSTAFIMGAGISSASQGFQLDFSVPFAFYADSTLLPAGDYKFEMGAIGMGSVASSVVIRAKDDTGVKILITRADTNENTGSDSLKFNRYGDKYFLNSISIGSHKAILQPTKVEQELRSQIREARSSTQMAKL